MGMNRSIRRSSILFRMGATGIDTRVPSPMTKGMVRVLYGRKSAMTINAIITIVGLSNSDTDRRRASGRSGSSRRAAGRGSRGRIPGPNITIRRH